MLSLTFGKYAVIAQNRLFNGLNVNKTSNNLAWLVNYSDICKQCAPLDKLCEDIIYKFLEQVFLHYTVKKRICHIDAYRTTYAHMTIYL